MLISTLPYKQLGADYCNPVVPSSNVCLEAALPARARRALETVED